MKIAVVFVSLLLSMTACSKKKETPAGDPAAKSTTASGTTASGTTASGTTATGTTATGTTATGTTATGTTATATAGKLNCDKIVPQSIRDKYFAGFTFTDHPQPVDSVGACDAKKGDANAVVEVTCHDNMAAAMKPSIDGMKQAIPETKDLPGVGKAAVIIEMGKDMPHQVSAWDDDSNCQVHVSVPDGVDVVALAKDMIAAMPPK